MSKRVLNNYLSQNLDKWGKYVDTNILYITGISGSGKSTLSKQLQGEHVEVIHLDSYFDILNGPRNLKFDQFLNQRQSNYRKIQLPKEEISITDWGVVVEEFEGDLEEYGKVLFQSGTKLIVEGVQLLDDTIQPDKYFFQDKPVILLDVDADTAMKRAFQRDSVNFEDCIQSIDFKDELMWEASVTNFKLVNSLA